MIKYEEDWKTRIEIVRVRLLQFYSNVLVPTVARILLRYDVKRKCLKIPSDKCIGENVNLYRLIEFEMSNIVRIESLTVF